MTIAQIATNLLSYFSPEERSVPDAVAYPGRNAAVIVAINAALQELTTAGQPWAAADERGGILNAPTSVTIALTAGSTSATITGWAAWMAGCAIAIEGEAYDNQIRTATNPVTLKIPSTVTGTKNATVYATSLALASDVMNVRSPVKANGKDLDDMNKLPPSDQYRVGENVSTVLAYRTVTWQASTASPAGLRLEFYPAPAVATAIEYKAALAPLVVTDLAATTLLPIPFQFAQSVFLPIAARKLMDSHFFQGNAIPSSLVESERLARLQLEKLRPDKTSARRLVPLG